MVISGVVVGVALIVMVVIVVSDGSNPTYEDVEYLEPIVNEQSIERSRQKNIDACISQSYSTYRSGWTRYCDTNGIPKDPDGGCSIPIAQANIFEAELARAKELCVERYK